MTAENHRGPGQSAPRTARAVARRELTAAILAEARRQLAQIGPAALSVRAVARALGMASSAVYRYFPSRDELLTELLVLAYDELGEAVEQADAAVRRRRDFPARWLAMARAVRTWAVAHPQDYALLYGSPVPGYAAPQRTIAPAARVTGGLIGLLEELQASGATPRPDPLPRTASRTLAGFRAATDTELPDDLALRGLMAWSGLIGAITLELFGHLHNVITDYDAYFDLVARRLYPG